MRRRAERYGILDYHACEHTLDRLPDSEDRSGPTPGRGVRPAPDPGEEPNDRVRQGAPLRCRRARRVVSVLDRCYNVADVREFSRRRLPRGMFEFIDRGAEDDEAIANNRRAFRNVKLRTQVAVDVSGRSTQTELFGRTLGMPVAIAPTGAAGLVWYRGELELARAAAEAGIPFTLASRSLTSIEDIAEHAGGTLWLQLYIWTKREMSLALVDRANAAGFNALIITLDVPVDPNREFNRRNGFSLPFDLTGRAAFDMLAHPRWFFGVIGRYTASGGMPVFEAPDKADNVTWDAVAELRRRWPRTMMVKGILRAEDARRAVECGADAVVVSNHGGRCLDAAVASIDVLPEIVDAVGGRAKILLDSGVRRGTDVVKALSLGASAVLSGRPGLWGLSLAGKPGAQKVLSILRSEMLTAMGQVGCPTIADLGPHIVYRPSLSRLCSGPAGSAATPAIMEEA
jgi:isopentenyl diphosphate isomerase/L-lactate dehydrogenase-like FMN-dependent dehydrogenase